MRGFKPWGLTPRGRATIAARNAMLGKRVRLTLRTTHTKMVTGVLVDVDSLNGTPIVNVEPNGMRTIISNNCIKSIEVVPDEVAA